MLRGVATIWGGLKARPLTRDRRLGAASRVALWQLRSLPGGEVVVPWIGGTRLALRRGMAGATGNVYCGLHEFSEMAFLLHWLREGDLFVDGGANVGSHAVLAAGARRARVVAFEPVPATAAALRRNVEVNGLSGLVEVRETALAEGPGALTFTAERGPANRRAGPGLDDRLVRVAAETLDGALAGRRPALAKLDLEGGEAGALRAARAAARACPAWIVEADDGGVRAALGTAGLAPHRYDPWARALAPAAGGGINLIWLRDAGAAAARLRAAPPVRVLGRSV